MRPTAHTLLLAAALSASILSGCQRSLTAIRNSGDRAYAEGNYELARAEYEEYLEKSPGNPEVTHNLGDTYLKLGDTAQARERLMVAYSMRLEDDEVFASLCEGLYADKKYEDLNRVLRQRTIDRGRMQDYLLLADFSQRMGDDDEAQRALITAAKVDRGTSARPYLELAKLYMKAGDTERAIERLRNAWYVDPTNGETAQLAATLGQVTGPTFGKMPEELMGPMVADPGQ